MLVSLTDEKSVNKVKLAKIELTCHSNIAAYFDIAAYLNISVAQIERVLGGSPFLVTRLGSIAQALPARTICHSVIDAHLDIAEHSEIAGYMLESIEVKRRDGG